MNIWKTKLKSFLAIFFVFPSGSGEGPPTGGSWDRWLTAAAVLYSRSHCLVQSDLTCPSQHVKFWLFARQYPNNPVELDRFNKDILKTVNFEDDAPLKVVVHGFHGTFNDKHISPVIKAYVKRGVNVISVDWKPLTDRRLCYYAAAHSVPTVGKCVAHFVTMVLSVRRFSGVHLIGNSLGAHVCSYASHHLPGLQRLTLLDPAFPLFDDHSPLFTTGVAQFTDNYYSNTGVNGRRIGNADVQVIFNDGMNQPGCYCDENCSHLRSYKFFAEGILNPQNMKGFPCPGWRVFRHDGCVVLTAEDLVAVGEDVNQTRSGVFMIFTKSSAPFLMDPSVYLDRDSFKRLKTMSSSVCKITRFLHPFRFLQYGSSWQTSRLHAEYVKPKTEA